MSFCQMSEDKMLLSVDHDEEVVFSELAWWHDPELTFLRGRKRKEKRERVGHTTSLGRLSSSLGSLSFSFAHLLFGLDANIIMGSGWRRRFQFVKEIVDLIFIMQLEEGLQAFGLNEG